MVHPSFAGSPFVLPRLIADGHTWVSVDQVTMSWGPRVDARNGRVVGDQCGGIPTVNIQDSRLRIPADADQ